MTDHLRDRIAAAIWERQNPGRRYTDCEHPWQADAEEDALAVLAELKPELDALAALWQVARGYCPDCGRGDAAPHVEDWEQQKRRADQADEAARLALEQRQQMAAERHTWQERGDRAEAALTRARDAARLHRQGLLSLTELYAVIGPALDTPEHAP